MIGVLCLPRDSGAEHRLYGDARKEFLMRSLRLAAAALALALVATACGDDADDEAAPDDQEEVTTTTRSVATTTSQPTLTTPTTTAEPTTTSVEIVEPATTSTTEPPEPTVSVAPPPPPSNLKCLAGSAANELLIEFDALPNPADISKIRTYMQVGDEPVLANDEFTVGQVDTTRSGGARWAAPVRGVPANVAVKLYATSFNQLGQESGWYSVAGLYTAPGAPCGDSAPDLPEPTCTAGCEEEEGEATP